MKPAFLETACAAAITLTALTGTVGAQTVCMHTAEMKAALKDWYGEASAQDFAREKHQLRASDRSGIWTAVSFFRTEMIALLNRTKTGWTWHMPVHCPRRRNSNSSYSFLRDNAVTDSHVAVERAECYLPGQTDQRKRMHGE